MSTIGQMTQQIQQDLHNELTTANQLIRRICCELDQIKYYTNPGGEFETNIKQNASLMAALANLQQVNIENLPLLTRNNTDLSNR